MASSEREPQKYQDTISSAVAAKPDLAPSKAAKQLFPPPSACKRGFIRFRIKEQLEEGRAKKWSWHRGALHEGNVKPDDEELVRIREQYGYKSEEDGGPSRLYLEILADALLPLPRDPMCGVVSPPLLATTGIVPLSIFSTGPDIIGHYYDCIVSARKEVILLTNYWQGGSNVQRIADALRELNARQAERITNGTGSPSGHGSTNGKSTTNPVGKSTASSSSSSKTKKDVPLEQRIIVKLMWDRGPQTLADLFRLRKPVFASMWKTNGLPTESEIPFLNVEILNYHRPLMGTFHAKLLIVDRQVALLNSNNIQDRPNLEACTRLEGDIVNSIYDHALISWGNRLNPPLPCLSTPALKEPPESAFYAGEHTTLPSLTKEGLRAKSLEARKQLLLDDEESEKEKLEVPSSPLTRLSRRDSLGVPTPTGTDSSSPTSANVDRHGAARHAGQVWAQKVLGERFKNENPSQKRHFADAVEALMKKEGIMPSGWSEGALEVFGIGPSSSRNVEDAVRKNRSTRTTSSGFTLQIPSAVKEEADDGVAMSPAQENPHVSNAENDASSGTIVEGEGDVERHDHTLAPKQNGGSEQGQSSKQVPQIIGEDGKPVTLDDGAVSDSSSDGGVGDDGMTPGSSAFRRINKRTRSTISRASVAERLSVITKALDFANNSQVQGGIQADELAKISNDLLDFQPYVFHKPHRPVPMALVNRRPHGTPGHSDIRNPQDAAWLAGFRYAEKHVFIQSPTLNSSPVKAAVLGCVRRHVRVELWLDLGFNDKSESLPFQGGTNESVVTGMYRQLRREGKGDEKYLDVYWYTGKDMTRPLNAVRKQRNCHVKFAAYDGQVAILGSGNQDTQSWFHSQEINVMVDSKEIVTEWMDALRRNQSTHLYGKVDQKDGIWHGESGSEVADTGRA
ncbi:unnamed protein product [Tilletia controversa]|uniref:PLD phosphodiesterase domain-containing protein n=3 Tax=Tilletia TaxID=13289 RepID=A0A8X7MWM1_9BASI|nr:hypothetical protein CF328_g5604 [Tilletia controversa]KAE8195407.1 hypothetical protein CF336_g3098 [Tilletia laevis]KAE8261960.1 hypothetical protein A4X03_0g2828 [Tilletia caries]KAE8205706.1 hypothetical protein CF335_g2212 [Tilletia laevis]KAE8251036.1 hypothetical protein A4X06_0g2837 [Tilletia controversa]